MRSRSGLMGGFGVLASASVTLAVIAAPATAATTPVTTLTGPAAAASPATALVADSAYRGAEHVFTLSNVAAAEAKFGVGSKADVAAKAALADNVTAIATLLTENDVPAGEGLKALLQKRDAAELDFFTASVLRHHKGAKAGAAGQHYAISEIADDTKAIGTALATIFPTAKVDAVTTLFAAVDVADLAGLDAQSRSGVDRFPKIGVASTLLSAITADAAASEVTQAKLVGNPLDPNSLARIVGAVAATQHVYLVGQLLQTGLATGTQSGQTKAAEFWVNQNSQDVAKLLGGEGLNSSLTLAAWTEHISGYVLYVAGIATGHKGDVTQAKAYLGQYETTLSNEIALKVPALSAATEKGEIDEHVTGTEKVAVELKANNPGVYALAQAGAQHLVDVFAQLAETTTSITPILTPKIQQL